MGVHLDFGVGGSFSSPPDKEMLMCCLCSIGFQLSASQPPDYQIGWQFNEAPTTTLHSCREHVVETVLAAILSPTWPFMHVAQKPVISSSPLSSHQWRAAHLIPFVQAAQPPATFFFLPLLLVSLSLRATFFIYLCVSVCVPVCVWWVHVRLLRDMQRIVGTFLGWLINPQ